MKKNILIITNKKNIYIKNVPIAVRKETLIKYLSSLTEENIHDDNQIKYYKNKEIKEYLFKELGQFDDIDIEELFDSIFEWKDFKEAI